MRCLRRRIAPALAAAALGSATALAGAGSAGADDIDALRARAQSVADEITSLDRRLSSLAAERDRLAAEILDSDRAIGLLEVDIHEAEAAYRRSMDRYEEKAVETYKSGGAGELELLLAADDISEMIIAAEAARGAAALDSEALRDLVAAREEAEQAQARADDRKQRLLAAEQKVEALGSAIDETIEARRASFEELNAEVKELELQARVQAAAEATEEPGSVAEKLMDAPLSEEMAPSLDGTGPANGIPSSFIGTGVSFEGEASWYGPGFEGNPTANGDIFDSSLYTAASKELPLGSYLYVTHEGKGVLVLVNDRGPYIDGRILDLSAASARTIGITGVGWIKAEVVLRR